MRPSRRLLLLALLALAPSAGAPFAPAARAQAPAAAPGAVVNVYNWTDYIDPAAIKQFEAQTGIRVQYDVYDSLETLEGKLLAGHSGYDVVVPTSEPTFSRLVRDGALLALDKGKVPDAGGEDPALLARVASSDPSNAHGLIYLWGTVGLGANLPRIRALAPDAPTDGWDLLLKPENARRIAPCGITMLDSAIDVIPSVLKYLGHDPNSTKAEDLADVERALMAIRPFVRTFASSGALEQLASGETCLAFDYSGDVIQAAYRAKAAGQGTEVTYVSPKEGAQLWFDMLAIPKDAPHPENAYRFIAFVLQPRVMAGISNAVHYANAVPASLPTVDASIRDNPNIYPPPRRLRAPSPSARCPRAPSARATACGRASRPEAERRSARKGAGRQQECSFLKKRTKKRLLPRHRACPTFGAKRTKSFCFFFFRKRRRFLPSVSARRDHPAPGGAQRLPLLRPGGGAAGRVAGGAGGRDVRAAGRLGLGQDHAAALHRRLRAAGLGPGAAGGA